MDLLLIYRVKIIITCETEFYDFVDFDYDLVI